MRKTSHMNARKQKKFKPAPAKFIIGPLMILFAITGCSDMPYTGSNLTGLEVNRYLVSTDGESVCFQDDLDATCLRLIPEAQNGSDASNRPAVYIYPERRVYMLYHDGAPIFRAERAQIGPAPTDGDDPSTPNGGNGNNNGNNGGGNNNGGNGNNNGNNNGGNGNNNGNNGGGNNNGGNGGDNSDQPNGDDGNNDNPPNSNVDGHGWLIWVYYPEEAYPNNAPTLSESGVTVIINGSQLSDDDITGFAQFISGDGERGVQFFYQTQSAELLDLKIQIEGVDSNDETIRFNINYLWSSR